MSDDIKKDWQKVIDDDLESPLSENFELDAEQQAGLEHPSYDELEDKLTKAEQQAHENWEKAARAMAELDNMRRRSEKEVSNAHRYAIEKFVDGLLPVVDSLEQALELSEKADNSSMHEGLELTMKLMLDVLSKFNVKQLNPVGEIFNPQEHEAMSIQVSDEVKPNSVLAVFQKGYKLHDRVVRPARVIVSKAA